MFALHIFLGRVINFKSQIIMRFCCYCGCSCYCCYCFSCHSVFGCLRANKSVAVSRLIYKVSHNHFFSPFCCLIACGIGGKLSTGNRTRTRIRTEPGLELGLGLRENVATMTLLSSQLTDAHFLPIDFASRNLLTKQCKTQPRIFITSVRLSDRFASARIWA